MVKKKNVEFNAETNSYEEADVEELGQVINIAGLADSEDSDLVFEMQCGIFDEKGEHITQYELREMTGRDQEFINKQDIRSNANKMMNVLLSRCIVRMGKYTQKKTPVKTWMNMIQSITTGDADKIIMLLREISVGDEIEVKADCPACKTSLNVFININDLEYVDFQGEREFRFELPRGYRDSDGVLHRDGKMRLPNCGDREVLTPVARKNQVEAETKMLARVSEFDDLEMTEDVLRSLVLKDRRYLDSILEENFFGYKLECVVPCENCGEEFRTTLNAVNFF